MNQGIKIFSVLCALAVVPGKSFLMAADIPTPPQDVDLPPAPPADSSLTPEQLDSLVAPIALYPDELVSQILVASTYPLEVVQAYQWTQQHPELKGKDLTTAAQQQTWDPSVQALVAFPDVMKRMNLDVTWTTNLGNAFLANQDGMMDEIKKRRAKAEDAGKLKSTQQQQVINTTDNGQPVVDIEPASPDVVYVPDYDPEWVWGPAPGDYPYPYWDYPAEPPAGLWCWWGGGIFVSSIFVGWHGWGGWGWHPGWHGHTIVTNSEFFVGNHFHETHVVNVHGSAVWAHDPAHRIGVAYPNRTLANHFNPAARSGLGRVAVVPVRGSQAVRVAPARVTAVQVQQHLSQSSTRVQVDRMGSRQISSSGYNRNRTAVGGAESGAAARTYSNRGNSSLSHVQPAGGGSRGGRMGGHR